MADVSLSSRLAAAGVIPAGADAHQYVAELQLSAETVGTAPGPVPAATAEESEKVLRWLESDGVRLVDVEGEGAEAKFTFRGEPKPLPVPEAVAVGSATGDPAGGAAAQAV